MNSERSLKFWILYTTATVFLAYQYILRVLPNILMPEIMAQFQVDVRPYAQFSGIYYIGYTLMHIPLGVILDRWGPKWVMTSCLVLTGAGLLPLIYTDVWAYPVLGRFLMGMGSSAAVLSLFKIIKMGFDDQKFTLMLGIAVTFGLMGAVYGGLPIKMLLTVYAWQDILLVLACFGVALALVPLFLSPKYKRSSESRNSSVINDITTVLLNPKIILICLLGGLMVGPIEGFADVWGSQFLKTVYSHLSETEISVLPSMIFLGMCFGATILSYIASKTKSYYPLIGLCGALMALGFIAIFTGKCSSLVLGLIFFITGILCSYQILVIYKATTFVSRDLVSITSASANMIIMIFGYFFHGTIGELMEYFWNGKLENGVKVYSAQSFIYALSIIPACLLIASIGFLLISIKSKQKARCLDQKTA